MPNYRQKNRNRNKNKNRNKQQQQQQQQQQQKQEHTKSSETSVSTTAEKASQSPTAESQAATTEEFAKTVTNPKELKTCDNAAVPSLDEHNVITCGTVASQPAKTCNESACAAPECVVANDHGMGNEKSKIAPSQEGEHINAAETQLPGIEREVPSTPRQQAKVIVHRIVCEDIAKEVQQPETHVNRAIKHKDVEFDTQVIGSDESDSLKIKETVDKDFVSQDHNQENEIVVTGTSAESACAKSECKSDSDSESESKEASQEQVKVIIHQIHINQYDHSEPAILSPVHIEEVGDESLTDVEELKSPVVSEVESAAEYEDVDTESDVSSTATTNREKRKQKRIALESHFLPQMLNPRFLDSISEENSDLSECGDNPLSRSESSESASNPNELKAQKLNAKFPKSSLDFSRPHKHTLTQNTQDNRKPIREEPLAVAVAARFQETPGADESCTTLKSFLSPESELAEMVFINSASSSMSDLNDMDFGDRVSLHSAHSVAFDLDTDARDLINKPAADRRLTSSASASSVAAAAEMLQNNGEENDSRNVNNSQIPSSASSPAIHQLVLLNCKEEQNSQEPSTLFSCGSGQQSFANDDAQCLLFDTQARLLETSCDAINTSSTSSLRADKNAKPPQVLSENVQNMNTVRDILNTDDTQTANINGNNFAISGDFISKQFSQTLRGSPPPPPIPPPPVSLSSGYEQALPLLVQNVEQHNGRHQDRQDLARLSAATLPKTVPNPHASPLSSLTRQESMESHCSDSTTFSQCTAINVGPSHNKASDYTSSISDLKLSATTRAQQSPTAEQSEDPSNQADPKKLRLLCAESLAALPYGDEVLEELATLAQNIGEVRSINVVKTHNSSSATTTRDDNMPYPMPELPHIDDLQLCLNKTNSETPRRPNSPNRPETWLGVPTNFDPKVLVCLSPSQRSYIQQQQQQKQLKHQHIATSVAAKDPQKPDDLLDAHQKFVERRGYHEYTKEQLANLEREKLAEQQLLETAAMMKKLRKSLTPPPPQIPPPPVPAKSSETAVLAQNLSKRSIPLTSSTTTSTIETNNNVTSATNEADAKARSDGEENKHRLLSIIQDTSDSRHDRHQQKVASTATSSVENNSRQTTSNHQHPATPHQQASSTFIVPITLVNESSTKPYKFPPSSGNMQSVESSLGEMFPTLGASDIFDNEHKRFSNIESSTNQTLPDSKPKRYSCVETHSYESQKREQNGQVVHDYSNSKHEKQKYGDTPETETELYTKFPSRPQASLEAQSFSSATAPFEGIQSILTAEKAKPDDHEIMSALKLNKHSTESMNASRQTTTHTMSSSTTTADKSVSNLRDEVDFAKSNEHEEQQKQNASERMTRLKRGIEDTYEEFRQRAKDAATAAVTSAVGVPPTAQVTSNGESTANGSSVISSSSSATTTNKTIFQHDHEKLFKEFDDLSKQLNKELEMGKTQREQKEKSASLFDLNRVQLRQKEQIEQFNKERHDHMKELEKEIERSMKSRQLRMGSLERTCSADLSNGRTYQIPIQLENGYAQRNGNGNGAPPVPQPPQTYQIPVQLENGSAFDDARQRRAESMFNLSTDGDRRQRTYSNQQKVEDDWSKYASDLGSSENIARPFAKEVEICYQRRPGGIRAPRLTASTNDLSYNMYTYDQNNAYNVRRSHAPMLNRAPQQNRPQFGSCYSMIERDPNPKYISTTTRRGVSPAPQPSGFHHMEVSVSEDEMRQRRASLPRELHEQQLKYIASKEEELRTEFERLQNERRRLMEEVSKASTMPMTPLSPRPMRDSYRCVPKLPTLTEDEVFRQQMAEEWLNKVAEREKRRLQNVIKISKIHEEEGSEAHTMQKNLGDEFLNRVKERRTKLAMPADSDWESGAESHPANQAQFSETEDAPTVKIIEGDNEANLRSLPRHLREFAKFSNHQRDEIEGGHREQHQEEERSQETTDNSISKAFKKSTVVKTVKSLRAPMLPENGGHDTRWHYPRASECNASHRSKTCRNSDRPMPSPSSTRRPRKQTRFLLPANRRSWSESDLLQEIDKDLKLAKGFLFQDEKAQSPSMFTPKFKAKAPTGSGIWSPKNQTPSSSVSNLSDIKSTPPTPPPLPTVWTPQQSPQSTRKEYRPIHFDSPTLPRRRVPSTSSESPLPPWNRTSPRNPNSFTNLDTSNSDYAQSQPDSTEFIPFGVRSHSVSDKIRTFERSASASDLYARPQIKRLTDKGHPLCKPNEVIYNVKCEYMSEPETENERPRKMAQLVRRQYDGIGPTTNDGMPIILRSEVKEPHQHEWYKRLYQTIHKQKHGDDYVIRYKQPRGRSLGKSSGYLSEPEPSYDSDYSTVKYRPVNSQRLHSVSSALNVRSSNDKIYGTLPNPVKAGQSTYKNQPGRIEDYVTGHSSVSEKESKEQLDQAKLSSNYTEGNLSRALAKESGYTSDSNLVFRKKEPPPNSPLSPIEQRKAYKTVQAGGEPPLFGFRKPAPEKSRDYDLTSPQPPPPPLKGDFQNPVSPNRYYESDVNIHFKTPVRQEFKSPLSEEELTARQAEQMQKLYQEERRRKYLQELQDMNSRRHTDNFTPSQKSPIALNRYDDFPADLAPKSINQIKSVARALYNFQAQNSKELSFKKGDIIYIRRAIDKNWYEGEHNAMIGLFPANYVEVINKEPVHPVQSQPSQRKPSEGQARAKYNFQAQSGVELSLNKGELVALTRRVDDNWFEGRIANRKGIFPVSYVEVLTDIGAEDIAARTTTIHQVSTVNARPSLDALRTNINNEFNSLTRNGAQAPNSILRDARTNHKTDILHVDTSSEPLVYRALYKYRPQNSDELELSEGDIVHVLEKCDDGWYVGTSQRTGCFGTFPGNYVERF